MVQQEVGKVQTPLAAEISPDKLDSERRVSTVDSGYEASHIDEHEDEGEITDSEVASAYSPEETRDSLAMQCIENLKSPPTVYGDINVDNSTGVHIGNKLYRYYQGPVTVLKQVVVSPTRTSDISDEFKQTNSGDECNAQTQQGNSDLAVKDNEVLSGKGIHWRRNWPCPFRSMAALGIAALILILVAILTLSTFSKAHQNHSNPFPESGIPGFLPPNVSVPVLDGPLFIVSRKGWLAQPVSLELGKLPTPVEYVIIIHSAADSCETQPQCIIQVRTIQMFHVEGRGWWDIGYNFLVGGDGYAYEGRGWDYEGSHSFGWNKKSIGICFMGTFIKTHPPQRQIKAALQLIELGVKEGKIRPDYKLLAHSQVQTTESPGRALFSDLQKWPHWYNYTTPIAKNETDSEIP